MSPPYFPNSASQLRSQCTLRLSFPLRNPLHLVLVPTQRAPHCDILPGACTERMADLLARSLQASPTIPVISRTGVTVRVRGGTFMPTVQACPSHGPVRNPFSRHLEIGRALSRRRRRSLLSSPTPSCPVLAPTSTWRSCNVPVCLLGYRSCTSWLLR